MENQPTDPGPKGQGSASAQHQTAAEKKAGTQRHEPADQKKKRYSRSAKSAQQFEKRMSKSAHRVSKAVEKGISTYLDERDRSLDKRKDGALIESYVNVATGLSEGIADASPAIKDVAKAINSKRTRRVFRNVVRALPFPR